MKAIIRIKENNSKIQVLNHEILLASFSDLNEAKAYAHLTEARLNRNAEESDLKPAA